MISRRDFLLSTTATAAASPLLFAADPASPKRKKPKFKLSLAAYSFNRILPRRGTKQQLADAAMRLEDFIDYCATLQLDGTELTGYYFPKQITPAVINRYKNRAFRAGLDISGTAIGNDFCVPAGPKWDAQVKSTREWIDTAAALGAPVIRIFAGRVPKGGNEAKAIERCIEGINQSLEYAAKKGVFLALENHGGITATPAQMLKIIKAVKPSPWFGVNFDSGNFRTADPYGDLEKIAPYAINAQIKVAITRGKTKEEADLKRIIEILKAANYRGYVVLEYEEKADPKKHIPRYIDTLRKLIA